MNAIELEHPPGSVLVAYGLGQIDESELADIDRHLAECELCRQVVEGVPADTFLTLLLSSPTDSESDSPNAVHHSEAVQEAAVPAVPPPTALAAHPRYRVAQLLGVGGMGAVYKAEHLLMERPVALKVLNRKLLDKPATVERFRREVRAAARLTHPNIVAAFDAEQAGDVHFLVMEYVEGVSLARRSAETGPLPIAEACDYIRQAASGLQHAHERGMVHRDIKPHNLMLTPGGQVKILDFGLARFAMESGAADISLSIEIEPAAAPGEENEAIRLTHTGLVMGTPDYIAPEQARDSHLADIRSDIYSLGCTFYELLAGQSPYPDGNALHKVKGHLSRTPQPLDTLRRDVPSELVRIVDRMMAKDPAHRYQTPADVAKALTPFVAVPPKPPRRKWKAALAACAAFLFIALAGIIYVQTDRGTIVIETNDEKVAVMIQNAGGVKIVDQATGREYLLKRGEQSLPSGDYQIAVSDPGAGFDFEAKQFELKRGTQIRLTAKFVANVAMPGDVATATTKYEERADQLPEILKLEFRKPLVSSLPKGISYLEGTQRWTHFLPEGLQIKVAKPWNIATPIGLETDFGLSGDFDLSAKFEDFHAEQVDRDGGGFNLIAHMPNGMKYSLARRVGDRKNDGLAWINDGHGNNFPAKAAAGTLRLVRTGDTLYRLWASPKAIGFQIVDKIVISTGDVSRLSLILFTNRTPQNVEVRVLEWRVQGRKAIDDETKTKQPDTPATPPIPKQEAKDGGPLYLGEPASFWLKKLQDSAPKFRLEAVEALGNISEKNKDLVPVLVAALKDKDASVSGTAQSFLISLGPDILPALLDSLDRKSPNMLSQTAEIVRRYGPKAAAAVPILVDALKMDDWDVRFYAMCALVQIGPSAKPAIPAMVDLLGLSLESKVVLGSLIPPGWQPSDDTTLPVIILGQMLPIDPNIASVLPEGIYKADPKARASADALLFLQYRGLPTMVNNVGINSDASVSLWKQTYHALKKRYPNQQSINPPAKQSKKGAALELAPMLQAKDEGPLYQNQPARFWLETFQDASPSFRLRATVALGNIAQKDKRMMAGLVAALRDRDEKVRRAAVVALGQIGPEAKPALPAMVEALDLAIPSLTRKKSQDELEHDAIFGWKEVGKPYEPTFFDDFRWVISVIDPGAEPALPRRDLPKASNGAKAAETDSEAAKWQKAFEILKTMYPKQKLNNPPPEWAGGEILLLEASKERGKLYEGKTADFWHNQYQDADPKIRAQAIAALGGLSEANRGLIPLVVQGLKDTSSDVGAAARTALIFIGSEAVPVILKILEDKSHPVAIERAAIALGKIGPGAKAAVPLLAASLKMDWDVRRASVGALTQIGPDAKPAIPAINDILGEYIELQVIRDKKRELDRMSQFVVPSGWPRMLVDAMKQIDPGVMDALPNDLYKDGEFIYALPKEIARNTLINDATRPEWERLLTHWQKTHALIKKRYP